MGQASSARDYEVLCDFHVTKEASAYCFTHKRLICMSCIAEKVHFHADCNVKEIGTMNPNMKKCLGYRQEIIKEKRTMTVEQRENKMQKEIEEAYDKAVENLKELKLAHLEVAKEQVSNMKESEDETFNKIHQAMEHYDTNNEKEAESLKEKLLMEKFGYGMVFEKVRPAFNELERSLKKVKDFRTSYEKQRVQDVQVVGSDFVHE